MTALDGMTLYPIEVPLLPNPSLPDSILPKIPGISHPELATLPPPDTDYF